MENRVEKKTDLGRFEIYAGALLAGIVTHENAGVNRAFVHTEIYPRYEGQGLVKVLIGCALDATRAQRISACGMNVQSGS
jgi:hypothetical protein